jgi:hypothetical protein
MRTSEHSRLLRRDPESGHGEPRRRYPDRRHCHGWAGLCTTQDTPGESRKELKVTISKKFCSVPSIWLTARDRVECLHKTRIEGIELRRLQSVRSADDLDIRLKLGIRDNRRRRQGHLLDPAAPQLKEARHQLLSVYCESEGHRRRRAAIRD